ncbi:MAG TPA: OsmC family protein, partial [Anaerolineales bacterium]
MSIQAHIVKNYQVEIKAGAHSLMADEPQSVGGDDQGPSPYDLLLASLEACKLITVQMYAARKDWPLEDVEIRIGTQKIHAKDCEDCESDPNAKVDLIEAELRFLGDLDADQRSRLLEISERCPVHRTLTSE